MDRKSDVYQRPINFILDKKNLENRVEKIKKSLEPFINQLLTPNPKFSALLKKGQSRNVHNLVKFLNESIENFTKHSNQLVVDYPDIKDDLEKEINNFKSKGEVSLRLSKAFADEPLSSQSRKEMANAQRELLNAVARLLAICDMIDEFSVIRVIETIQKTIVTMKKTTREEEFISVFKSYTHVLRDLFNLTSDKDKEIKSTKLRNDLTSARSLLIKQNPILYTSSMSLLSHPKSEPAKALHEQVFNEAIAAIDVIHKVYTNTSNSEEVNKPKRGSNFLNSLIDLDNQIIEMNAVKYKEVSTKTKIENQLEDAIKNINSYCSKDLFDSNSSKSLIDECNAVRKALQDLLSLYGDEKNKDNLVKINSTKAEFVKKSRSIRRQIRKLIAEQFALQKTQPLEALIDAAKRGNQAELDERIVDFKNHTNKLFELSLLAAAISTNTEGIEHVEMSINRLKNLLPQLINSAQILCSFPTSKKAQDNMEMYRKAWLNELKLLYLAIDDITSVNDFLAVSEARLLEDINKCISALTSFDAVCFEHTAQQVASRVVRICNVVNYEMFNYEPCDFTKKVLDSVFIIKSTILNNFVQTVEFANKALKSQPMKDPNENEFIDASRQIYYSIRDLRNALLLIPQENDSDNMFEVDEKEQPENVEEKDVDEEEVEVSSETPLILNQNITQEQKEQINQHLDLFHEEKNNFDREVLKWDDTSNDIVVLAKQMSVIMMDMTNFTRGKGPYKRISDVIAAAKKISEIGTKLEKLVKDLASQCPESPTKVELLSYLNKIPLFCNQLNIGSKVKENVIDPDSASSLIISSKNLMNAVISVVKSSYVASTKYTSKTDGKKPIVQWKMKPPELKPLINTSRTNEAVGLIRKASKKEKFSPIKALSEFQI